MKNINTDAQGEFFSIDPEENLRIENEILHLKLKAQLGGELVGNLSLPPELENKFIKNILDLEHAFEHTRQVGIFDLLGQPSVRRAEELDDQQIELALTEVCELMASKNIELDFAGEYNARLKYAFITDELFERETDDIDIPGFVTHFIYEEFHPNHKLDIESRAIEFIEGWCSKQINEESWELGNTFILENGRELLKRDVLQKIKCVFESYREFANCVYSFVDINFEIGMGFAGGVISYEAILENGEILPVKGSFKIYLSLDNQWWNIIYFVFPGFNWR
jgi:hypothetical protein